CSRSAAMRSGVACWPRIARAGSPGSNRVATNTSRVTDQSTTMLASSRRRINRVTRASSAEPDVAERVTGQRQARAIGDQARDVHLVGVDLVDEAPDDVAAALVLDALCLMQQFGALRLIQGATSTVDKILELGVVPVGLVVRRVG